MFAAVLLSRFVIEEFRSKSITVLFMYPISRKRLIAAKLAIVVVFTFCAIILSTLFVTSGYYLIEPVARSGAGEPAGIGARLPGLEGLHQCNRRQRHGADPAVLRDAEAFGRATIVSSILMIAIISSNTNGFSLGSIIFVPLALAVIGGLIAYFTIRNIDRVDVTT